MNKIKDTKSILMQAAHQMDIISKKYCPLTGCNQNRMKGVDNNDNCEWYHGAWMYCRLSGIVVSEDYLGVNYQSFFQKHSEKQCSILICGTADFAIVEHIIQRIPERNRRQTHITILDICNSPLLLCQWFINNYYQEYIDNIDFVQADATNMPFEDNSFDLITTYSFLTRMVYSDAKKVVNEWHRVLKSKGTVLTTVRINNLKEFEGKFYRSNSADEQFALDKLDKFLFEYSLDSSYAEIIRAKVKGYISNIMSVAISSERLKDMFNYYICDITYFDQPGELESVHEMAIVNAIKCI